MEVHRAANGLTRSGKGVRPHQSRTHLGTCKLEKNSRREKKKSQQSDSPPWQSGGMLV